MASDSQCRRSIRSSVYVRFFAFVLTFLALVAMGACGSGTAAPASPTITVAVSPTSASVQTGGTQQFQATVTGTTNTAVTWSVDGVVGGNTTTGTISTAGMYTAPGTAGSHTVTVTSAASTSVSATAAVTVTTVSQPTPVTVTVSPTTASVQAGATQQFTATVTGNTNTSVTWLVDGVTGGGSTSGTISTAGLYTAAGTAGSHKITAVSVADTSASGSATVTVTAVSTPPPAVTVAVLPTTASIQAGATQQFTATVTGTTNTAVTWSVDGVTGGGSTMGTVSGTGLYAAPSTAGSHIVMATSVASPTSSGSATVTVTAAPPVTVAVTPATASIQTGATQTFAASVTGTTNTTVTWSVDGVAGGSATVGTISAGGVYTAPGTAGSHTVTATSVASPTSSGSATVAVTLPPVTVTVSPGSATVVAGATQQFAASVTGTTNAAVTWSVDGVAGGSATAGTISATGLYTAPSTAGSHTVLATSVASSTSSGSASVTVTVPTVTVTVSPSSVSIVEGATQQFSASVTGTTNTAVTWSVDNVAGGNATVGTISATGLYTAPNSTGQHSIVATSVASPTSSGSATVTLTTPPVTVTISPTNPSVQVGATLQFTAKVTGTTNTAVTWSVDGVGGGNTTVGTISAAGLYTAPSTAGQHTVMATSVASPSTSASTTVTVTTGSPPPPNGDITINFNGRSGGVAIPSGLFGSQLGNLTSVPEMKTLVAAGITGTRTYANVAEVFASQSPNWSYIDTDLSWFQQSGLKAILMIAYTPPWLLPATNPCASGVPASHAAPSNNSSYASIAAQYVAHIDQKFPGVIAYYEIWNEPDEPNQFCGLNAGDKDQVLLNEYKAMYQPVATAMKAQAAKDGVTIQVGGPGLGNYNGSEYWISQLVQVTNNGAKIVDFASYHQYPSGSDVSQTMTWDGSGGTVSLYSRTIDPNTGLAAIYQKIVSAAASGSFSVPVILDEFNDDWDFSTDCCKNTPAYSPLWNTIVVSTILDTVYSGSPAVQHLSYYAADNQPFCLLGYISSAYGCGTGGTPYPYPQFRAFELMASPNYLDLQASGGNMAKTLSLSNAMNSAGLVALPFYTSGSDAVVLVNPLSTPISNAELVLGNHGLSNPTATQYLLNGTTYSPTSEPVGTSLELTINGSSATASVSIPAYSVLAIKVVGQ